MHGRPVILFGLALVAATHLALVLSGIVPLENGGRWDVLWDPDSYTRLMRVQQLREGGGWWEPRLFMLAPPEGMVLHWTRLLDAILIAGAAPLAPLLGWPKALLWFGILLGPLLHLSSVPLLSWASRPVLSDRGFALAAVLLAINRPLINHFSAGQIDHHGLESLLLLAVLACLLRDRPVLAGLAAGTALWVSPETLLFVAVPVLWLGLEWLQGTDEAARRVEDYAAGLTIAVGVALAIERPPGQWLVVDYDRLSAAHGAAAAIALVGANTLKRAGAKMHGVQARAGLALALAAGGGGLLMALLPGLTELPEARASDLVRETLLNVAVSENPYLPTDRVSAYWFLLDVGPAILPLLWLPWVLRRPVGQANATRWRLHLIVLVLSFGYALSRMRGINFLGMALVLPAAESVVALGRRRLTLAVVAGGWWWGAAVGMNHLVMPTPITWGISRLCRFEALPPFLRGQSGAVLTTLFEGPELAWRTGRPSVAGPYHGATEAVRDLHAVLRSSGDDHDAREVLSRRQVAFIVACRYRGNLYPTVFRNHPERLISRLAMGKWPPWLAPVPLPDELEDFIVYRVRRW